MSVVVMILAATAIPVELRPQGFNQLGYGFQFGDIAANALGYVPLGLVLGELGAVRAVLIAGAISTIAEASQFAMMFRDPSLVDIGSNVLGAVIGTAVSAAWKVRQPGLRITKVRALIAAMLAVVLVASVRATAGDALNGRGATSPGILEAHWTFDDSGGRTARDSSGNGLDGVFNEEPKRTPGPMGQAVRFEGPSDYIRVNPSTGFRMVGSMSISAWIYSTSYPRDDAAIVSNFGDNDLGYQLDTTIDSGPRTVGFKLNDVCQNTMSRYGATPLATDTWYHVAGVYDANARTLDVYVNGKLDNGLLKGTVSATQRSSREPLYIGRRSDLTGYAFAGAIDDVRVYSRALTPDEIVADMRGIARDSSGARPRSDADAQTAAPRPTSPLECAWSSEFEDRKLPLAVAVLGMLVAAASIGFAPRSHTLLWLAASPFAGALLFLVASPTLPRFNVWAFPLVSFAGAASIVLSVRRRGTTTAAS